MEESQEPEVEFASVTTTGVTLFEGQDNTVSVTVSATFNEANTDESVAGQNLWQVRLWFSKAEDGQGSSVNTVDNSLSSAQSAKSVNFNDFTFEDLEISADLTSVGCGKYQYICAQIRRDDPEPSYKQVGKTLQGTLGCAPVECGSPRLPTPHIVPTSLTITETSVTTGERNTIDVDISVFFDQSQTDDVTGEGNWKIIVWLSDEDTGNTGSRIAETEETITLAQMDQPLTGGGPLTFR
ncbi:putative alpha-1 collagen isoform X4, partial [Apostichopus japonicus]